MAWIRVLRMRTARMAVICGALLAVLAAALPAFGQAVVQRIDVQIVVEPLPHRIIVSRLQATVESVAERLLLGRSLDQLVPLQPRLGETIGSVVERVATGYAVANTAVQLGSVATVVMQLRPVGTVMRDVSVIPDLRNIHARVHPLVLSLLQQGAIQEARALASGLPVGALEWAQPLIEARARGAVEEAVVGYTATVRVQPGTSAQMDLLLTPRDSRVVRNIGVRFRSGSIPTLFLDQHGPQVASMADPMRGLPVAFAETHRRALERQINDELAAYPPARQYGVVATATLDVAETTYVTVVADSLLYRGKVEARLNIGRQAPGPEIVAHLGRLAAPNMETFAEVHLVPSTLSLEWDVGASYALSPATVVGTDYALVARTVTLWTTGQIGRDVGVRGSWNLTTQSFEGALTYRINEFLAGEVIGTSRGEFWLRLISNL